MIIHKKQIGQTNQTLRSTLSISIVWHQVAINFPRSQVQLSSRIRRGIEGATKKKKHPIPLLPHLGLFQKTVQYPENWWFRILNLIFAVIKGTMFGYHFEDIPKNHVAILDGHKLRGQSPNPHILSLISGRIAAIHGKVRKPWFSPAGKKHRTIADGCSGTPCLITGGYIPWVSHYIDLHLSN